MLAASSILNSNLACSSRLSSYSDFTSGHSWRPIEAVKLHRTCAVSSIRISCVATKPAKTPGTVIMLYIFLVDTTVTLLVIQFFSDSLRFHTLSVFLIAEEEWKVKRRLLAEKRVTCIKSPCYYFLSSLRDT